MSWTAIAALTFAAALAVGMALVWIAQAVWVHIISARWNAMCADEEPPPPNP